MAEPGDEDFSGNDGRHKKKRRKHKRRHHRSSRRHSSYAGEDEENMAAAPVVDGEEEIQVDEAEIYVQESRQKKGLSEIRTLSYKSHVIDSTGRHRGGSDVKPIASPTVESIASEISFAEGFSSAIQPWTIEQEFMGISIDSTNRLDWMNEFINEENGDDKFTGGGSCLVTGTTTHEPLIRKGTILLQKKKKLRRRKKKFPEYNDLEKKGLVSNENNSPSSDTSLSLNKSGGILSAFGSHAQGDITSDLEGGVPSIKIPADVPAQEGSDTIVPEETPGKGAAQSKLTINQEAVKSSVIPKKNAAAVPLEVPSRLVVMQIPRQNVSYMK
ncbi:unnamed protein product [Cyprideis torosa]|uniref:Uncharacterized protein n=1 Tax=Cyprideis torosa TaxID=163714 RepID=A0A7R8ZNI7_9CRUS|nr:unnamed protein product [Cyprideis torosa]CAG0891661.1 unnamed protein product [Cyprideis torosa]